MRHIVDTVIKGKLDDESFSTFSKSYDESIGNGFSHDESIRVAWAAVKSAVAVSSSDVHEDTAMGGKKKNKKKTPKVCSVCKVDDELGIVFGWAIISKIDGEDYVDLQNDNIPENEMLKSALGYAEGARAAKNMHIADSDAGSVPFVFPLTEDICKSLGIESSNTGMVIGMKPKPEILAKFKSGEYTGFSIGGVWHE